MLKKVVFLSVLGVFCVSTIALQAQVMTNTATLDRASQEFRMVENNNYAKALLLAKQHGWPLTIMSRDNRQATLVG
ncbi:MAG TPA: hypothetical protein VLD19_09895, partial [Chitinophagaceae bacterium]|nr:hypothetical protein [Chitinophagaceae bacterium]